MLYTRLSFVVASFFLFMSLSNAATTTISPKSASEADLAQALIAAGIAEDSDYQIGDEFGKKPVTPDLLKRMPPVIARAALATARYGGGTAFYLGVFNGHHMMATNHHVMPDGAVCATRSAIFPIIQKKFRCEKFYGDWKGIDLALFSITVPAADEELMAKVGRNFNFNVSLYPGQDLITIGFGVWKNPGRDLMANFDADCKVFSAKDDYRFIADPDRINPSDYKTWSFSTGCDVSHGDSGSAMVDRQTGEVVGIIWTTATQKPSQIQSSQYLDEVLKRQTSDVWTWLSYSVPAQKIRSFLAEYLSSTRFSDPDLPNTIGAVISDRSGR